MAEETAPIGLVSMVKGPVQIQRAGKAPVPVRMADLVGPGDRLIAGAGGERCSSIVPMRAQRDCRRRAK